MLLLLSCHFCLLPQIGLTQLMRRGYTWAPSVGAPTTKRSSWPWGAPLPFLDSFLGNISFGSAFGVLGEIFGNDFVCIPLACGLSVPGHVDVSLSKYLHSFCHQPFSGLENWALFIWAPLQIQDTWKQWFGVGTWTTLPGPQVGCRPHFRRISGLSFRALHPWCAPVLLAF